MDFFLGRDLLHFFWDFLPCHIELKDFEFCVVQGDFERLKCQAISKKTQKTFDLQLVWRHF